MDDSGKPVDVLVRGQRNPLPGTAVRPGNGILAVNSAHSRRASCIMRIVEGSQWAKAHFFIATRPKW